jgi:hypothetical protein
MDGEYFSEAFYWFDFLAFLSILISCIYYVESNGGGGGVKVTNNLGNLIKEAGVVHGHFSSI